MAIELIVPYQKFTDTSGGPLDNGYLYIGAENQNPEINPISIYWDADMTIPAANPVRTIAGNPSRSGTPGRIFCASKFSLTVKDSNLQLIYSYPSNELYADTQTAVYVINSISELSAIPSTYTTTIVKDLDRGGTFIWSSTGVANGGTVFAGATGYWTRQYSGPMSVKWFGAVGDGVTDDTTAIKNALTEAEGKELIFEKTDNFYLLTTGVVVYEGTSIDGRGSSVIFKYGGNQLFFVGFVLSNRCSIKNMNGYRSSNGFTASINSAFITVGLFYAPTNAARAYYVGTIPGIVDANSAETVWDAPYGVTVENIESDISSLPTTNNYDVTFIFLTNFIKNISIRNIKAIGFGVYVDEATSWNVTTGNSVTNPNNYYNVVRFEWGHFVTGPTEIASGENITCDNIYGKGLVAHNHSAVVSMGNAHSYIVNNIVGEDTAQIFHVTSSGDSTTLDSSVLRTNATNRKVTNATGLRLYTWFYGGHYLAGINIGGSFEMTDENTPFNNVTIENINLTGLYDATRVGVKRPEYGVVLGDSTWANTIVDGVVITNIYVSNFRNGLQCQNANNIIIRGGNISYNGNNGIAIASSAFSNGGKNIRISEVTMYGNNLDGSVIYTDGTGTGLNIFRADNVIVENCVFGDSRLTLGTETQLNSVFLRNGDVRFVSIKECIFANYSSGGTYDINANATTIMPIVTNCRSIRNADRLPSVYGTVQGLSFIPIASATFTSDAVSATITRSVNIASIVRVSTGRYAVTFSNSARDTNFYVIGLGGGASTPEFDIYNYAPGQTATGLDIYVKDASGAVADPSVAVSLFVFKIYTPQNAIA